MPKKVRVKGAIWAPRDGAETPDQTPVEMPLGYSHPESLEETVMRLLRSEQLARLAKQEGVETFEEFMDFGDESDDDPRTPHEEFWDPIFQRPTTLAELRELDRTLAGGGSVQFSEEDNLALRRYLREVAAEKAPIPSDAAPSGASGAGPAEQQPGTASGSETPK